MSVAQRGIEVQFVSNFSGGITKAGKMSVAQRGIEVQFVSNFSGGITNAGSITSARRVSALPSAAAAGNTRAINVANTSTFAGGITNTGSLVRHIARHQCHDGLDLCRRHHQQRLDLGR
jgi:hypothetical protein